MKRDTLHYVILGLILAGYLALGLLYALYTPEWQAPDEPAHYNTIAQIATEGCCPVIAPGDWDSQALAELLDEQFPEGADVSALEYQDHQPPLYYLVGSLIYRLGGGMLALRIMSLVLGSGVLLAAYFVTYRLFPAQPVLALGVALFVAFVPQHMAILASINNDSLANTLIGILLVVLVTYLGNPIFRDAQGQWQGHDESSRPHAAALGGLLGVVILSKLTIYFAAGLVLLAVILRWRIEKHPQRWLWGQLIWIAVMALLIGGWWPIRNILVYGWPDAFGQIAHNAVTLGQLRTSEQIAALGFGPYLLEALRVSFNSFWGQFGWMAVPMPPLFYTGLLMFSLVALAGFVLAVLRDRDALFQRQEQRAGAWVLALAAVLVALGYVYYNLNYYQVQGRYLFPALIPIAVAVTLGLWALTRLVFREKAESGFFAWLPLIGLIWLPALAAHALFRFIIPYLG